MERLKELVDMVPELKTKGDERGWVPIHICSAFGHLDLVKWLSVNGVNLKEETPTGYTAIHLAAMNGHVNCMMVSGNSFVLWKRMKILYKANLCFYLRFEHFMERFFLLHFQILSAMGCPISSRTVDDFTPLHLASMR